MTTSRPSGDDGPAVVAVVLAAGAGTRFRGPGHKLDARLDGRAIVDRAVGTALAAGIGPVVVVTAGQIATTLHPTVVHVVNERWAEGQSTSLRAGIDAARELGASAVVVGLGDQPFVTVEAWRKVAATDSPIAIATYAGRRGHPVRLHRETWDLLPDGGRRRGPHADAYAARSRDCSTVRWFPDRHRHHGGSPAMAEQLVNEFTVNRPIDEAWAVITDVERIAPCLPGAQLQEIEGDIYRGVVKIKLGSIAPQFKGQASFIERDDAGHRALLKAEGRDTGGRGNASAEIEAHAESLSPTSTRVIVTTDLHITGKVAQFGRGIIGDVSKKLMAQFAGNLNTMLDEQPASDAASAAGAAPAADGSDVAATGAPAVPDAAVGHRPVTGRERPRRRHAPSRGCGRRGAGGAAHPQDRQPGQRARRSRRGRRPRPPEAHRPGRRRAAAAGVHRAPPALSAGPG